MHTSVLVSLSFIIPHYFHYNDDNNNRDAVIWLQSWFQRSAITSVHVHVCGFAIPPFIDVLQTTCSSHLSIGKKYKKGVIKAYGIVLAAFARHPNTLGKVGLEEGGEGCTANRNRIGGAKAK